MADAKQVPRPHLIRVHVYEARGLTGKDTATTMSSSLAVVKVGPTARLRRETETKYQTVNAAWDRTFIFENVMLSDEEYEREKITIEVYDRNALTKNEFIGSHEFSLDNVHRQNEHEIFRRWVPLSVPNNPALDQGYLLCSVYVLKDGDPTPTHRNPEDGGERDALVLEDPDLSNHKKYTLNVLVYRATNLVPTKSFGSTVNPFVSVRFNGNTIQTQRLSDMANPIWNRKLEMPFTMPLDSDSIEVQVWNSVRARPDVLIGSQTFSYFELRLTHRPWGPRWVPLYSSDYIPSNTTFLGTLMDSFSSSGQRNSDTRSEFVGRLLLRLSVAPVPVNVNPRLSSLPCNQAIEPPGEQYVANLVLYSGSEIPVQGGTLRVEMTLGHVRVASKWVLGKEGVFTWNQILDQIVLYAPKDLDQCADLILNVFHKAGATSRKIAFERIKVKDLLPERSYYLNGESKKVHETSAWRPKWRTLRHVHSDPKQSHIVAGFLLCTIGFGVERAHPPPARLLVGKSDLFTLRVRLVQAANLPAADDAGSANPFLVVRFAGRTARFSKKRDTLFPFWYETRSLVVPVDKRHAPSIYLMVYHENPVGIVTLLGRAEVLAQDITPDPMHKSGRFAGRLMRVPLLAEEHIRSSAQTIEKNGDQMPYVLLSLSLDPHEPNEQLRDVVPPTEEPDPKKYQVSYFRRDERIDDAFREYAVKIEAIGLRQIVPLSYLSVKNPAIQVDIPDPRPLLTGGGGGGGGAGGGDGDGGAGGGKDFVGVRESFASLPPPAGGSVAIMNSLMIRKDVFLPLVNLHGVPLRIRLYEQGIMASLVGNLITGGNLIGSVTVPVANFISGPIERPPLYVAVRPGAADGEEDEEAAEGAGAAASVGGAPGEVEMGGPDGEDGDGGGDGDGDGDGDGGDDDGGGGGDDDGRETKAGAGGPAADYGEEETEDGDLTIKWKVNSDKYLTFDTKMANLQMVCADGTTGKGDRNINVTRAAEKKKEEVGPEVELRPEYSAEQFVYHELALRRGRTQRLEPGQVWAEGMQGVDVGARLKAFIRVAPRAEAVGLQQDDLLAPIRKIYDTNYRVRLYVYRGVNLTPRRKLFAASGRQSADSYLVASNGRHPDNNYIDRSNYHADDVNPDFYQVIELPASLPQNNLLELAVWDRDDYGTDELIGSTLIDLEWRLLHGQDRAGDLEYRVITRPGSRIAQGKLLVRCDVVQEEVARRTRAEDLRPPVAMDYELRLVIWSTRGVKLPELADRDRTIDMRVEVTTNFTGTHDGEVVKKTDVAFESTTGAEDFNYRMIWKVQLPCKVPRMKITLWDDRFPTNVGIGEVLYNLQPLFARAQREKQPRTRVREAFHPFTHPNYRGAKLGEVNIELLLLTAVEAEQFPAGEAQNDPNRDPYLPKPHRNLPSWAVGSRGLAWMRQRQALIICLCILAVVVPFLTIFLVAKFKNGVV